MTLGDVINGFVRGILDILIRIGLLGVLVYSLVVCWYIIQAFIICVGKLFG